MLRFLALVLLVLNMGYFAWAQDMLRGWGYGPTPQSEPQRLRQQLYPEDVRVLGSDETKRLEALAQVQSQQASAGGARCMSIGLFDSREAAAVREALTANLAPESWEMENGSQPARWIVYMGRYDSRETQAKKKIELLGMDIKAENPSDPSLEPGLVLGGYETASSANAALAQLTQRGVRTARVVLERGEMRGQLLRLPQADDRLRAQLAAVKAEGLKMALEGKTWQPCPGQAQ